MVYWRLLAIGTIISTIGFWLRDLTFAPKLKAWAPTVVYYLEQLTPWRPVFAFFGFFFIGLALTLRWVIALLFAALLALLVFFLFLP